jgi:hypothetical protein
VQVDVGEKVYIIPKKNLLEFRSNDLVESFVKSYKESTKNSDDLYLFFEPAEIRRDLKIYPTSISGFDGNFQPSLIPGIRTTSSSTIQDGWTVAEFLLKRRHSEKFSEVVNHSDVIPDTKINGHFRLYNEGHRSSWLLIDGDPTHEQSVVIAYCIEIEIRKRNVNFNCKRVYKSKNYEITYSLYQENYQLYDQIDNFILKKLAVWEKVT